MVISVARPRSAPRRRATLGDVTQLNAPICYVLPHRASAYRVASPRSATQRISTLRSVSFLHFTTLLRSWRRFSSLRLASPRVTPRSYATFHYVVSQRVSAFCFARRDSAKRRLASRLLSTFYSLSFSTRVNSAPNYAMPLCATPFNALPNGERLRPLSGGQPPHRRHTALLRSRNCFSARFCAHQLKANQEG